MREADIQEIAAQTMGVIRELDTCHTINDLDRVYDAWKPWAASRRVCPQIFKHVETKFFGIRVDLPGARKRADAPPTDRKAAAAGDDR